MTTPKFLFTTVILTPQKTWTPAGISPDLQHAINLRDYFIAHGDRSYVKLTSDLKPRLR